MLRVSSHLLLVLIALFLTAGCLTTGQYSDYEIRALEDRILLLQKELQNKDSRIAELELALEKEKEKNKSSDYTIDQDDKYRIIKKDYYSSVIKVQTALKNAGFDPGLIDGKVGKRTQSALRRFQQANGLPAHGCLDKQTWSLLRNYL